MNKPVAIKILAFLRKQSSGDIRMLADAMHLSQEHYHNRERRIFGLVVAMGASWGVDQKKWDALTKRAFPPTELRGADGFKQRD